MAMQRSHGRVAMSCWTMARVRSVEPSSTMTNSQESARAEAAKDALGSGANRRSAAGRLDCFATDTSRLDELAPRFLGEALTGFELVDL
jgi:hypothetical protein